MLLALALSPQAARELPESMAARYSARALSGLSPARICLFRPCNNSVAHPSARSWQRGTVASMATAAAGPKYYILNYSYVPDILKKRGPYREKHLAGAQQKLEAGKLVMAGAAGDPVEGAVFVFKNATKDEIEQFIKDDPYVQNGLVPTYDIKPYTVVVGNP